MIKFTDHFVQAGGYNTRYWTAGQGGIPLVMLHGLGGTIEDWAGTLGPLSAERKIIAIDLLGSGKTERARNNDYSIYGLCNHVVATLDALKLGQVDLNGWSLGGRVALEVAATQPERINRLVLTAPAGLGPDTILDLTLPMHKILLHLVSRPTASARRLIVNAIRSNSSKRLLKFTARRFQFVTSATARAGFLGQLQSIIGPSGYLSEPRLDIVAKLADIAIPTLAIWGREDHLAPANHADILSEQMPHFHLELIDDCGHTPHIEWPEAYNAVLSTFLK